MVNDVVVTCLRFSLTPSITTVPQAFTSTFPYLRFLAVVMSRVTFKKGLCLYCLYL